MKPKKFFASVPEVKKIDEDARTIEHVISTGVEDRDGDTINPKGWILDEFLKNPVVLFGHRHDLPPIARAVKLKASEKGLETLTLFPPKGISPVSDTVFDLNRLGFLRSWSVGFDPVKFNLLDNGGTAFEEQKLLEYSSVPVPANPEAVNLAVSKGIMTDKMLELFEWQKVQEHTHDGASVDGEKEHAKNYAKGGFISYEDFPGGERNYPIGTQFHQALSKTLEELDIDPDKLQSCFDEGITALQISGAHHARILRPGKTIRA